MCLLPENDYQRWQLQTIMDGRLRWIYERIHFDPKPIDSLSSVLRVCSSAQRRRDRGDLAQNGKHANVVNFAFPGTGRDIQWAIVDELLKAKSPKRSLSRSRSSPTRSAVSRSNMPRLRARLFPPTPFLHNYLYNLAYLPIRKLTLFGANLFPGLFRPLQAIRSRALRANPDRLQHELYRRLRQTGRHGASGSARNAARPAADRSTSPSSGGR